MKFFLILAMLLLAACTSSSVKKPFVKIKPEPQNYAWWLRSSYLPNSTSVNAIPVKQISKEWCRANAFSVAGYVQTLNKVDAQELIINNAAFEVTAKFDGMRMLSAIAGVYGKCNGEQGNFILIVDPLVKGADKYVSVIEFNSGNASFISLALVEQKILEVMFCMECDNIGFLRWNSTINNVEWFEPDQE